MKNKNIKINKNKEKQDHKILNTRAKNTFFVIMFLFILLIVRLMYIQFVKGPEYKEMASMQQLLSQVIAPKRGTIYDSTGKALAISASVDTITINPQEIVVKDDNPEVQATKTAERKELVATKLSEMFELDYQEVFDKVNSDSTYQVIAKKVTQEKVDELTKWMEENEISSGINIDETDERFYPYDTLASNLIGFCGTEGYGLEGLEETLDDILSGTPGRKVSSR